MRCPSCGLINPASAPRCDCGFDLKSPKVVEDGEIDYELRAGGQQMWVGGLLALIILLVSVATIMAAHRRGGTYILFTGLFGLGLGMFRRGSTRRARARNLKAHQDREG